MGSLKTSGGASKSWWAARRMATRRAVRDGAEDRICSEALLWIEKAGEISNELFSMADFALPDYEDSPAELSQVANMRAIPSYVAFELGIPIRLLCSRDTAFTASRMQMPETAMNEDDSLPRGEDHVRLTRQGFYVKAIAVSQRMGRFSHGDFGLRILTPNAPHIV